jgi:nitrogen fixation/metabolism regulation signal transduction histidine kinase
VRTALRLYLVIVHLVFALAAAAFLWTHRAWLLVFEVFFVVSLAVAWRLLRAVFEPLDLVRGGIERLRDSDFTTRLHAGGPPDLDELAAVYNQMADRLRDERTRQQEQEAFLSRVLDASPAGVVVLDFEGRIASANPAAQRILAAATAATAFVGHRLADLDGPIAASLACVAPGESRVVSLLGGRRVRCQRGHFLDRGFQRPFLILEELTDELRRSEKAAYDKLIRMMSHEVNNTAAAVGSLLSACLAYRDQVRAEDRGEFTTALEVAIARGRSLSAFTNAFAEVVRLPPPRREPAALEPLVRSVATLMRPEAERRRIALHLDIDTTLPAVALDSSQMEQALLNIVKNALESIERDGVVILRLERTGGGVALEVRDTGRGIDPGVREHLFTPFFTTKENGQGIGLTLAREILIAHGFDFELENRPEGGAHFTIRMRPAAATDFGD